MLTVIAGNCKIIIVKMVEEIASFHDYTDITVNMI